MNKYDKVLQELYRAGFISHRPITYFAIARDVKSQMSKGKTKYDAVIYASEKNRCSIQHVYKVYKKTSRFI